jgi:single-strand DNA-binding protein
MKEENDMARGVNKVILVGNLGSDPQIHHTKNETAVATLSLATNTSVKRGDEWREETEWHRVVAWGRLAEICGEYMTKGSSLYIEGRLRTRSWEEDGNKRYVTEVLAKEIQILGRKDNGAHQAEDVPSMPEEEFPF